MRVVVLVGLPGSGKSTYLRERGITGLSSDSVRLLLADDETIQTIHDRVFETLRYLLRQRLMLRRPETYIDATNLRPEERAPYIAIGKAYGYEVEALFFDVPPQVCRERNAARQRIVPPEAMEAMAARLVPPAVCEGFSAVRTISSGSGLYR